MSPLQELKAQMRLPVIAAPMFIVSQTALVKALDKNARTVGDSMSYEQQIGWMGGA